MSHARILKLNDNELVIINDENLEVYLNLARSYEAEFSNLTHKMPNEKGIFEPDTIPSDPYVGYLLFKKNIPIGFCLVDVSGEIKDVAEFYIIPSMRKNKYGMSLAASIFQMFPGKWQVRQIEGAESAKAFWRKVIKEFTQNEFSEVVVNDPDWGIVTRQNFVSPAKELSSIDGLPFFFNNGLTAPILRSNPLLMNNSPVSKP